MIALILLVPFGFNLAGTSLYLYIHLGSKDLIVGASIGVSHNAIADAIDDSGSILDYGYDYPGDEYNFGPVDLVIEPNNDLQPLRFDLYTDADYLGFDFPWLLLPLITLGLAVWRTWYVRRCPTHGT